MGWAGLIGFRFIARSSLLTGGRVFELESSERSDSAYSRITQHGVVPPDAMLSKGDVNLTGS